LLRGLDIKGSGYWSGNLATICQLTAASSSTIRQWLREGTRAGAFRYWRGKGQRLRVALTSLHKVCLAIGLNHAGWGATAEIPLTELSQFRPLATAAIIQREQQLSRFAAWRTLKAKVRRKYSLPHPEEFFTWKQRRLSDNLPQGSIRCVIHVGASKVFTSLGFIPYGISQDKVAFYRGKSDRTVRRHLTQIGIEKRQICQAKAPYGQLIEAMRWDCPSIAPTPDIHLSHHGDEYSLYERSGREGQFHAIRVHPERFFSYGGRHYIYRCNVYRPQLKLCSMARSILNYKALLKKSSRGAGG